MEPYNPDAYNLDTYNPKEPNYVLKVKEAVQIPEKRWSGRRIFKICVFALIAAIAALSLLLRENLFLEMSWAARLFLAALVLGALAAGRRRTVYSFSTLELRFFDDGFVLYIPRRCYGAHAARRESTEMKYAEVAKCVYNEAVGLIKIYGSGTYTWQDYQADGTLSEAPAKVRHFTDGMIYFTTFMELTTDFVREIEEHSPLHVLTGEERR